MFAHCVPPFLCTLLEQGCVLLSLAQQRAARDNMVFGDTSDAAFRIVSRDESLLRVVTRAPPGLGRQGSGGSSAHPTLLFDLQVVEGDSASAGTSAGGSGGSERGGSTGKTVVPRSFRNVEVQFVHEKTGQSETFCVSFDNGRGLPSLVAPVSTTQESERATTPATTQTLTRRCLGLATTQKADDSWWPLMLLLIVAIVLLLAYIAFRLMFPAAAAGAAGSSSRAQAAAARTPARKGRRRQSATDTDDDDGADDRDADRLYTPRAYRGRPIPGPSRSAIAEPRGVYCVWWLVVRGGDVYSHFASSLRSQCFHWAERAPLQV